MMVIIMRMRIIMLLVIITMTMITILCRMIAHLDNTLLGW